MPPPGFLAGLRALCDEHDILLIFDEVQCGMGRTGRMFACEHFGVAPDIMTLAKDLGSGLPIGAVVARRSLMRKWTRGAHGNTFGGNPVTCAAALATLSLVERGLMANAVEAGAHLMAGLRALARDHPVIGEVRGLGLMVGMEIIDPASGAPAGALSEAIIERAFHHGLLLLTCGSSTLRFMPPLSVTKAEIDEALVLLRASLAEALSAAET